MKRVAALALLASALSACSAVDRMNNVGETPKLSPILNPLGGPLSAVPVHNPTNAEVANSLWQPGAHSFFQDSRATHVGDVITVDVTIADSGQITNATTRTRQNSDAANLTNFFGLETKLPTILQGSNPASLVNMGSQTSNVGAGSVNRAETINLTLAALVTTVLPNGNLVIGGHQQVRMNNELRDLSISGVVRREDITSDNTVNLAQIAEARISYGGKGQITDVQQPRYGDQLFDILMPF
ncbi:MAG TPA: flagellar basal body L-ring protein FlgH [Rhizomicrobium sp.]|jgi:flagellar L-ring protein precursor FlgH